MRFAAHRHMADEVAVDTEADDGLVVHGLDVDIAGAHIVRLDDDGIDQLDDRGVVHPLLS